MARELREGPIASPPSSTRLDRAPGRRRWLPSDASSAGHEEVACNMAAAEEPRGRLALAGARSVEAGTRTRAGITTAYTDLWLRGPRAAVPRNAVVARALSGYPRGDGAVRRDRDPGGGHVAGVDGARARLRGARRAGPVRLRPLSVHRRCTGSRCAGCLGRGVRAGGDDVEPAARHARVPGRLPSSVRAREAR